MCEFAFGRDKFVSCSEKIRVLGSPALKLNMKIKLRLAAVLALAASIPALQAGDITGTVTLKGTPTPEKPIPLDPACGKMHAAGLKTRLYLVDAKGGLA